MATFPESSMANWPMNLQHLLGRVDLLQSQQYHQGGPMDHLKHKMMDSWDQVPAPEAAFLGPQLWDKKISMKMFNNDSMACSPHAYNQRGYDSSPSPPRFQQQAYNNDISDRQSKHFPHNPMNNSINHHVNNWSKQAVKDWSGEVKERSNFKMEPSSDTSNPKFHVSDSDLALATVPGVDFDPTKRCFSAEELKPQPIIKKRKKITTPDNKKDDQYWAKRSKNNFAAKRSREARRLKENQIALRASYLEKQNIQLKMSLKDLHVQNSNMKVSVEALKAKIKARELYQNM